MLCLHIVVLVSSQENIIKVRYKGGCTVHVGDNGQLQINTHSVLEWVLRADGFSNLDPEIKYTQRQQ